MYFVDPVIAMQASLDRRERQFDTKLQRLKPVTVFYQIDLINRRSYIEPNHFQFPLLYATPDASASFSQDARRDSSQADEVVICAARCDPCHLGLTYRASSGKAEAARSSSNGFNVSNVMTCWLAT